RGASEQEIMEAIWVAAEMRAGGAYAHSVIALDALAAKDDDQRGERSPALRPNPQQQCENRAVRHD
ncbi:MAG TPA: hypothetical protein VI160_09000, partial [Gemmatimonadales bacterium]